MTGNVFFFFFFKVQENHLGEGERRNVLVITGEKTMECLVLIIELRFTEEREEKRNYTSFVFRLFQLNRNARKPEHCERHNLLAI